VASRTASSRIGQLIDTALADTRCSPGLSVTCTELRSSPTGPGTLLMATFVTSTGSSAGTGIDSAASDEAVLSTVAGALQDLITVDERIHWPACPAHPRHVLFADRIVGLWACPADHLVAVAIGSYCTHRVQ
jgi:hypothetical protein